MLQGTTVMEVPPMATTREVAAALQVSRHKAGEMVAKGVIRGGRKIGGRWRVPRSELQKFVEGLG